VITIRVFSMNSSTIKRQNSIKIKPGKKQNSIKTKSQRGDFSTEQNSNTPKVDGSVICLVTGCLSRGSVICRFFTTPGYCLFVWGCFLPVFFTTPGYCLFVSVIPSKSLMFLSLSLSVFWYPG